MCKKKRRKLRIVFAYHLEYFQNCADPINHEDKENIAALVKALADYNYSRIFKRKREIERLTDCIAHIHPLRVIEYIYTSSSLKNRMPKILDDALGYKRTGFLNGYKHRKGLCQRMDEQMEAHNIFPFLPEFAENLDISANAILPFFYSQDWEGLLRYLLIVCP